jgi:transposase
MAIIKEATAGTSEGEPFRERVGALNPVSSREQPSRPVASSATPNYRQLGRFFSYMSCEARVPEGHPLRPLRAIADEVLEVLSPQLGRSSASGGGPSIAPEKLLRLLLLEALYAVRSEGQLIEQLGYNLLFRWFVGLSLDAPQWDTQVFTKNRERLLASDMAAQFFTAVLSEPRVEVLLSNGYFSVDRARIEAWTMPKSLKSRNGSGEPPKVERDEDDDLYGENGEKMPYYPARPRRTTF